MTDREQNALLALGMAAKGKLDPAVIEGHLDLLARGINYAETKEEHRQEIERAIRQAEDGKPIVLTGSPRLAFQAMAKAWEYEAGKMDQTAILAYAAKFTELMEFFREHGKMMRERAARLRVISKNLPDKTPRANENELEPR